MADDQIHYETLVQDALRNVIRAVLEKVAQNGLPGEHHFFITFRTQAKGVMISKRLKERYPEQMTIVLQHQYWDLRVEQDYFSATLSFGEVPEKLVVPFSALQVFYDPTAAFEAAFDIKDAAAETDGAAQAVLESGAVPALAQDDGKQGADVVSLDAFRKNR